MTEDHPNIALLRRLDPRNMAASTALFASELVVVQSRNTLTIGEQTVVVDVVVVWRFVDGRVVEVWDIVPGQATEVHDAEL